MGATHLESDAESAVPSDAIRRLRRHAVAGVIHNMSSGISNVPLAGHYGTGQGSRDCVIQGSKSPAPFIRSINRRISAPVISSLRLMSLA